MRTGEKRAKTNTDVAAILDTGMAAVKKHLGHIYEKLGVEAEPPLQLPRSSHRRLDLCVSPPRAGRTERQ